jgi:WD40 repeat protein
LFDILFLIRYSPFCHHLEACMRRKHFWLGCAVVLVLSSAVAQPPALPPVAPAQARLDQTINGLDGPGTAVVYSDEAGILAAACEDGSVLCWYKDVALGVRAGDGAPLVLKGHAGPVIALAWPAGPVLASAGADHKVLFWEMPAGKLLNTLDAGGPVRALALAPDGKLLATAGDDGVVQLWDAGTGKPAAKLAGHGDWVVSLAFSPDGKQLASAGYDGTVRLWDPAAAKKLFEMPATPPPATKPPPDTAPPPTNVVWALAFAPDGKLLAIGGSDAQVHLFTPADGKYVRSLPGHTSSVTALQFHPSGTLLVSASKDRTVRLWDPAGGQPIKALEGHTAWAEGVTFVARGTRLASVGADRTVRLWDLTEPKK